MFKIIVESGERYGRLTIIKEVTKNKKNRQFLCQCDCGNEKTVLLHHLKNGDIVSCGCFRKENPSRLTHGGTGTRLFRIWTGMKSRCYNQKVRSYSNYGARGINICDEWLCNFEIFYDWAIAHGYSDNLSIDRKDNDGNYEPSNCRWATTKEQDNNKRSNRIITYQGQSLNIKQWSEILNIGYAALKRRLYKGWSIERAFNIK